ncbi:DUF2270 domain-containing protein [Natrinema salifodinae]|uniref:Uncharacterized membrane protein n=1 Tax=Natrinema salifodinae TaxID=1202768 RepID=A0A1I0MGV9_9EURY|nr:DUF2270 domain-containing protein [Natrinema salifodinae]SEV87328.1 Uncharacterized membrane protein [Natrinema salifodinae]
MAQKSAKDVDPADAEHREIGEGLLEEDMAPSSAMAHLYRGEVHRMKFWRERLDRTSNWAVIVMSGVLTWGFSGPDRPHYILLLGGAAVTSFLLMEAQRYRGYDLWRGRVRTLQKNVFAYGLDPSAGLENPEWRKTLSRDYRTPVIKITTEEAIAHRLRRIYLLLFTVTLGAWVIHIGAFATEPWPASASIGAIPGLLVTSLVVALYLVAVFIAVRPRTWLAEDELHSRDIGKHR